MKAYPFSPSKSKVIPNLTEQQPNIVQPTMAIIPFSLKDPSPLEGNQSQTEHQNNLQAEDTTEKHQFDNNQSSQASIDTDAGKITITGCPTTRDTGDITDNGYLRRESMEELIFSKQIILSQEQKEDTGSFHMHASSSLEPVSILDSTSTVQL